MRQAEMKLSERGHPTVTAIPRVYVLDDDEQMRALLVRQLGADYDIMCFATADHFLDVAAALSPGCLVLDVHMPSMSGLEVQHRLAERSLHFPTIMITGLGEVRIAVEAMKAGAIDFIEKPFTRDTILERIRMAQHHCDPTSATNNNSKSAQARLATLSTRELEVLKGLVAGLPNKTIAYDLGISARTVEVHRANLMKKMEARSFSALLRSALAAGIR